MVRKNRGSLILRQRQSGKIYHNFTFNLFDLQQLFRARGKRNFSPLKLVKFSQTRSTSQASMSNENEVAGNLDSSSIIKEFADRKPRRAKFNLIYFHLNLNLE